MSLRAELMAGFALQRLGMLMEPEPGNPQEVEGVPQGRGIHGIRERKPDRL